MFHSSSLDGLAVGGGADLVRNVDAALSWETSSIAWIDPRDCGRSTLEALTSCLTVRSGLSSIVECPNSTATC